MKSSNAIAQIDNSIEIENQAMRVFAVSEQLNSNDGCYYQLELGNGASEYKASFKASQLPFSKRKVNIGDILMVSGFADISTENWLSISKAAHADIATVPVQALLPHRYVAREVRRYCSAFNSIVSSIQCPDLARFIRSIFANHLVAYSFGHSPASNGHHHSFEGGLFQHSLEVTWYAAENNRDLTKSPHRDLLLVLGLVHDIGKVVTFDGSNRTDQGSWQCTDSSALQVLNDALKQLDEFSHDNANTIRAFFQPAHYFPQNDSKVVSAIRKADTEANDLEIQLANWRWWRGASKLTTSPD